MPRALLAISLFLCWSQAALAQSSAVDSLDRRIAAARSDTARISLQIARADLLGVVDLAASELAYAGILAELEEVDFRPAHVAVLARLTRTHAIRGDAASTDSRLREFERLVASGRDSTEIGELLATQGIVAGIRSDHKQSIPLLRRGIDILERHGGSSTLAAYYSAIGIGYQNTGDFAEALRSQQAGLRLAQATRDHSRQATLLVNMAATYFEMDDQVRSEQAYRDAIAIAEPAGYTRVAVYAYSNLATNALAQERWEDTYRYAEQAATLAQRSGDPVIRAASLSKAALAEAHRGNYKNAEILADTAIAIAEEIQQPFLLAQAYASKAESFTLQKRFKESIPLNERAKQSLGPDDYSTLKLSILSHLVRSYEGLQDYPRAFQTAKELDQIKDSLRASENVAQATELAVKYEFEKKDVLAKAEQAVKDELSSQARKRQLATIGLLIAMLAGVAGVAYTQYRRSVDRKRANDLLKDEKAKVESTLTELRATQAQLLHSEKMASLGELTAGIAHEIQNPLNFVNNFSEVSQELLEDMTESIKTHDFAEAAQLASLITDNLKKINHHGKRADSIVKGMLQHSRKSTGIKEETDLNQLCDEYLRLAYHGLRAKDRDFNAELITEYDQAIRKVPLIAQDFGRVVLNLFSNAFYAVRAEQQKQIGEGASGYKPTVRISTMRLEESVEIVVYDNGGGIPPEISEKIFQPFFTTKPTGQGTGLGLSLSYEIVQAHNGSITVDSKPGEFTVFTITLPTNQRLT